MVPAKSDRVGPSTASLHLFAMPSQMSLVSSDVAALLSTFFFFFFICSLSFALWKRLIADTSDTSGSDALMWFCLELWLRR